MTLSERRVLYGTQRSPFARRVRLALLTKHIVFEWRELTLQDLFPPTEQLLSANPFGLVPALVELDGFVLFDSSEILAHIDFNLSQLWPKIEPFRRRSRRISSLAQGILTYAVREFQDLRVKSVQSGYVEDNIEMIARALKWIEKEASVQDWFFDSDVMQQSVHQSDLIDLNFSNLSPSQAAYDIACAFDYLDFRMSEKINWRVHCPSLQDMFAKISTTKSFSDTRPTL